MAALAVVVVVDHRYPLLALAHKPAQGKIATKERDNPRYLYVEVSDDLSCGILFVYCCGRSSEYRSRTRRHETGRLHSDRCNYKPAQATCVNGKLLLL